MFYVLSEQTKGDCAPKCFFLDTVCTYEKCYLVT